MKDLQFNGEPMLVKNPDTGRWFNIEPYTFYLKERCQNNPAQLVDRVEDTIRFIAGNFDKDIEPLELKNTLGFLFEIKDMFDSMNEYKQTG